MRHGRASIRFRALVLRGRLGSAVVGAGRGLSCRRCSFSSFWPFWRGRARHGTIIRFAHQQTPSDLQRVKTRPSLAILCGGLAPFFETRLTVAFPRSPSVRSPRARAVCASPCGTDRLGPFAYSSLRWFFVGAAPLHLAKGALTLHLFLQNADCGVDVVVADIDQHRIVTLS